ncbi:DUF317 domain-containing protein [Streptomyces tendae]
MVQQPAPPHSDRRHPAPRARDQPLRSTPAPTGGWSQRIEPPPIPERFTLTGHGIRWTSPDGQAGVRFDPLTAQAPRNPATWTIWAGPTPPCSRLGQSASVVIFRWWPRPVVGLGVILSSRTTGPIPAATGRPGPYDADAGASTGTWVQIQRTSLTAAGKKG